MTLACLQDLSQARGRWGSAAADGFFSLFGAKVLLPGVGDLRTLDTVSRLAGQGDVAVRSVNASAWWSGRPSASTTRSTRRQERLPVDQVHSLAPGTALVIAGARPPQPALLTPWWAYPPFSEAGKARHRPCGRRSEALLPAPHALPDASTSTTPASAPGPGRPAQAERGAAGHLASGTWPAPPAPSFPPVMTLPHLIGRLQRFDLPPRQCRGRALGPCRPSSPRTSWLQRSN